MIDFKRYVIPLVIGLAPPLTVALTWNPAGDLDNLGRFFRGHYLALIGAELFVILIALREGLIPALRRWDWPRSAVVAALLLVVVAVSTIAWAPMTRTAVTLTLYWLIHAAFALSVAHLCGRLFRVEDLMAAYLAGFAVFALQFLLFIAAVPDWSSFDWRERFMMFTHVRHAGYYLAAMAGLAMGAMAVARSRTVWAASFLLAVAATGIAMWTGSRGAMLAVAGAWAAGLVFAPAMRRIPAWGGGLASMAAALALVTVAPSVQNHLMGLERTVEATAKSDVTTGRTAIWAGALEAVKKQPLLGYGDGQMRAVAPYSTMIQPHNVVLQIALAWGIVGLACAVVLALAYLRRALPAIRQDSATLTPPFLGMSALAILSLYDGALFYVLPISIFFALGAAIAASWKRAGVRSPAYA